MNTIETIPGGVTAPEGFRAAGVACGSKPGDANLDLAIVHVDADAHRGGAVPAAGVFTTNLVTADPDKLLIKRIVLTGVPTEPHNSSAIVKHMFYKPEDIRYFKKVELRTKMGMLGHIKEARGTKGDMKCIFDGNIQQNDTVCMSLYKRQFPKWDEGQFSV